MLADAISQAYGLAVTSVTPIHGGYTARCFDVRSPAVRFVAKVWRGKPPGETWVPDFLGVPPMLRTREGDRIAARPLGPMCLQPYVSGVTPPSWPCWPPGEPLRSVLQGYGCDLRLDRLAFLMLRRYLGDALARINRREDRDGIVQWGVRQWDRLDEALQTAARVL